MIKQQILVIKNKLHCNGCNDDFNGYSEVPDEGYGHASLLYECSKCFSFFSHLISDEQYLGSVQSKITKQHCPECNCLLEDNLVKCEMIGICPICKNRDYSSKVDMGEEHI